MWINVDGLACRIDELIENGFVLRFSPRLQVFGNDGKLVALDQHGTLGFVQVHMPQAFKIITGERNKYERN